MISSWINVEMLQIFCPDRYPKIRCAANFLCNNKAIKMHTIHPEP